MMEKSCGWWFIWYLLFFCHGGAEVQLQWVVKEKVTAYGQNLILFCPVENCCSEPAGWSVGPKSIIIDVKRFSNDPKVKYHGTYTKDGFGVVIRNLSEADLNVTYRCNYGFDQSTPKYLLDGDVFRENVPDKDKEIDTTAAIVVPIVAIVIAIGFIIGIVYCVRSRIKKKRQRETGNDEEIEVLYHPDIQVENQLGTDEEMKNLNPSDSQMKNQQGRPSIQITSTNTDVVEGQSHTITCSISNISDITDITWIKTSATDEKIAIVIGEDGKFSGGTLSDPSLTINNIDKSDEGTYACRATNWSGATSSEDSVLICKDNPLSKEGNNFVRLYLLCHKIGTQAVRFLFDCNVPGLDSFLKQHRSNLTYIHCNYKCTKEEKAKLFPGGQVAVDSADFDFSLLYKLLRNLVTAIPAPTRGWGIHPLPTHLNETDDIERIRHLRTILAHNSKLEISEADFSILWTDLSEAINRLSKDTLSIDVKSMRMKSFDRCIKNEMEEDVRKVDNKMREVPSRIQNIPLSKEVNHFLRLYLLCHKTGTQVVRDFFDSNVPDLNSFLKQHKSSGICTREQKALMFPGGQIADNSADFDFTLLYKLIRNFLTTIPAPACGWGNQPFPGNLNAADDIERIRHYKNSLTHNSKFEICDTDFSTLWNDLSKVIERLSNSSLLRDVESMRMKSFDKGQKNEMEEDIRKEQNKIPEDFMGLQQQVADNTREIADNTGDPQH